MALTRTKETLIYTMNKRMLLFLPYLFVVTVRLSAILQNLRDTKAAVLPALYVLLMPTKDRFYVNQWTGYIAIVDGCLGIVCIILLD